MVKACNIMKLRNLLSKKKLQTGCTVQPQTKEELAAVIKSAIATYGNEVDLNFIDTSKIINMSCLFQNSNFNGNINGISKVYPVCTSFQSCSLALSSKGIFGLSA